MAACLNCMIPGSVMQEVKVVTEVVLYGGILVSFKFH